MRIIEYKKVADIAINHHLIIKNLHKILDKPENTVLCFMSEGCTRCVKEKNVVVGVLLFSKKHNIICCLAVAPDCRRHGIASTCIASIYHTPF